MNRDIEITRLSCVDAEQVRGFIPLARLLLVFSGLVGVASCGGVSNPPSLAPASQKPAPSASLPTEPARGTLSIRVEMGSYPRSRLPGPWIYVNSGQIAKANPDVSTGNAPTGDRFLARVPPGRYTIEVGWVNYNYQSRDDFILKFLTLGSVVVAPEKTVEISGSIPQPLEWHSSFPAQVFPALAAYSSDEAHIRFLDAQAESLESDLAAFERDLLVHAIFDLDEKLVSGQVRGPIAPLAIPEKYGGVHDLDAVQVRLVADWIKYKYWLNIENAGWRPQSLNPAIRAQEERVWTLRSHGLLYRDLADELKIVARRLEYGPQKAGSEPQRRLELPRLRTQP